MSEKIHPRDHDRPDYTSRLQRSSTGWRRALGVQLPYRANVRRVVDRPALEIGCGTGRLLQWLGVDAVGVDTNPHSVAVAREGGLRAWTTTEFEGSEDARLEGYRTLLFAHVLEHMTNQEAASLIARYLTYLVPGGRIVVIVPQGAGFRSDPTHVQPVGHLELQQIAGRLDLEIERFYSFPFPAAFGKVFRYNESVALLAKGGRSTGS